MHDEVRGPRRRERHPWRNRPEPRVAAGSSRLRRRHQLRPRAHRQRALHRRPRRDARRARRRGRASSPASPTTRPGRSTRPYRRTLRVREERQRRRASAAPGTSSRVASRRSRGCSGTARSSPTPGSCAPRRTPDLVIASTPSLSGAWSGARLARRHGVPFGVVVQDLVGQAARAERTARRRRGRRVPPAGSRVSALRSADVVAVVSDAFRQQVDEYGVDRGRVAAAPQLDAHRREPTVDARRGPPRARLVARTSSSSCTPATWGSSRTSATSSRPRAGSRVAATSLVVLMGDGNQRAVARRRRARASTCCGSCRPVDGDLYPDVLRAADVLLVNERPSVGDMSLPEQADLLLRRRPVRCSPPSPTTGACARELAAADGAGVRVAPGDPAALADAIETLADDRSGLAAMGAAGADYAERVLGRAAASRTRAGPRRTPRSPPRRSRRGGSLMTDPRWTPAAYAPVDDARRSRTVAPAQVPVTDSQIEPHTREDTTARPRRPHGARSPRARSAAARHPAAASELAAAPAPACSEPADHRRRRRRRSPRSSLAGRRAPQRPGHVRRRRVRAVPAARPAARRGSRSPSWTTCRRSPSSCSPPPASPPVLRVVDPRATPTSAPAEVARHRRRSSSSSSALLQLRGRAAAPGARPRVAPDGRHRLRRDRRAAQPRAARQPPVRAASGRVPRRRAAARPPRSDRSRCSAAPSRSPRSSSRTASTTSSSRSARATSSR